jgi:hypothetical protein
MPFCCFIVNQGSEKGIKNRVIYAPPFEITVIEMIFGLQIIEYFVGNKESSICIGNLQVDIHNIMKENSRFHNVTGDFSGYDRTLSSDIMFFSFMILKGLLNLNTYESALFDKMVDYILFGRVYHPHTKIVLRNRGMPSGSFFTNLVDSISNLIINYYSIYSFKERDYFVKLKVCGDDNLIITKTKLDTNKLSQRISTYFDMKNNFLEEDYSPPNSNFLGSFLGSR